MPLQVWVEQQTILVKIENVFLPRIKRQIEKEYRAALAMVREYGLEAAKGKVLDSGIDTDMIAILTDIYQQTGLRMARVSYRDTMRKYPIKPKVQKASGMMGHYLGFEWL